MTYFHCCTADREDNISLDTIVGWVESAGYKLARVADYGTWYARFKQGLEALDHRRQASSSLPIVYQWQKPLSGPVSKCVASAMVVNNPEEIACQPVVYQWQKLCHMCACSSWAVPTSSGAAPDAHDGGSSGSDASSSALVAG